MNYSVYNADGMQLTAGLQGPEACDEAAQTAQRMADQMGQSVWVGPDGAEWEDLTEVSPGQGLRRL